MHLGNNEYGHSEFGSTKSIIVELVVTAKIELTNSAK